MTIGHVQRETFVCVDVSVIGYVSCKVNGEEMLYKYRKTWFISVNRTEAGGIRDLKGYMYYTSKVHEVGFKITNGYIS